MTWRRFAGPAALMVAVILALGSGQAGATGDPAPSVKAPLSTKAYSGLACNPFDKRLRKTSLNNGVGPEARVAAACWALEWRARGKVPVPTVTVHASPGFPAPLVTRVERGITAGHRLFGGFADVSTYEAITSIDTAYSCATGKRLVDPRRSSGSRFNPWTQTWNSGCPDTDYSPGGWTSTTLGDGGREYFAWTLIKPEQKQMLSNTDVLGPTWFMGAVSHEFVHSIQMQRSDDPLNGGYPERGQESIGRWFGEGQAQYLGNYAASLTIGPKDIRSAQLSQLREVMREEGVKVIDLESMERDWQTNLVYPAGYFAYEWLVAHYGSEATFTWWNQWNAGCEEPGSGKCWRAKAPETFGMSAGQLLKSLNNYVNAQVAGAKG